MQIQNLEFLQGTQFMGKFKNTEVLLAWIVDFFAQNRSVE